MKIKIILPFCLFFFFTTLQNAFSQQINGEATYGMKKVERLHKKENPKYKDIKSKIDFASSNIDEIEYKLFFNTSSQIFFYDNSLGIENHDMLNIPLILAKNMGTIYTDLKDEKTITQKDGLLIEGTNEKYKWKLENITKTIGQYKCYKATVILPYITKYGKTKTVEAWYAPEISMTGGPLGFSGLPGLILELKDGNKFIYHMKSISFSKTKMKELKKPTKGKKITKKEYDKKQREKNKHLIDAMKKQSSKG